ncbi:MAG: 2-hydroxyacid dehydrogenase [Actinomycetaceae bacterium]|nr:2-hydroxyacid dehydrogenase [Actinomycetaceae bacterium]
MKVLLAADQFLTEEILKEALLARLPEISTASISSTWPVPPFHDVAEVREAHGDEDELIAALKGVDVAFSHTFPFTEKVIASSPDLKMITICRGGPVNVNIDAATEHGVLVSYTPGRNAVATAEHTVALILASARQVAQRHQEVVGGQWRSDYYIYDNVGPEIGSSTIGVIGYGNVGRRVANILAAFGGKVLVYDPWAKDRSGAQNIEFVDQLEDLLTRSDIVTLHVRESAENHHMMNSEAFALMPESSIFINAARGSLVDYDALADALDSGHLFAAGLDCLPEEPLPVDHRLMRTRGLTFTPHLAGASKEASKLAARIGADDIATFVQGGIPKHLANPEVLRK